MPRTPSPASAPHVSLLMVARNSSRYIGSALRSASEQSFMDMEIVVVDDGSTDDTRAIALAHAHSDPRVRVIDGPCTGLAAVRNASLHAARGRWAAILDSDDLIHPRHIERLVAEARSTDAQIVAANMVQFAIAGGISRTSLFANTPFWRMPQRIGLAQYVRANSAYGDRVCAGYLKPLLDLAFLRRHGIAYDPRLRIAEDYDLVARMLARGARFSYLPRPSYFYRRHESSTSHRQSEADLLAMRAAAESVLDARSPAKAEVLRAVTRRAAGIDTLLRHTRAVGHLKSRRPMAAIGALGRDARAWALLASSAREGIVRRLAATPKHAPAQPVALVIGRPEPGSALQARIDQLAASGVGIVTRPAPADDNARATMVDGLPALAAILAAPPASEDDAAYAMIHAGVDLPAPFPRPPLEGGIDTPAIPAMA